MLGSEIIAFFDLGDLNSRDHVEFALAGELERA
jgi:hypothetical protein